MIHLNPKISELDKYKLWLDKNDPDWLTTRPTVEELNDFIKSSTGRGGLHSKPEAERKEMFRNLVANRLLQESKQNVRTG